MTTWRSGKTTASIFFYLCSGSLIGIDVLALYGEKFSINRLFFFAAIFALGLFFLAAGWNIQKNPLILTWWTNTITVRKLDIFLAVLIVSFFSSWVIIWVPLERFGKLFYYAQIAHPVMLWFTFSLGSAFILLYAYRHKFDAESWFNFVKSYKAVYVVALLFIFLFFTGWWVAYLRVFNVLQTGEDFWNGAGVPVLAYQVFFALIIGFGGEFVVRKTCQRFAFFSRHVNLIMFLFFWAVSAWMWASEPVKADFLITDPVKPNYEMYPDYDARNYDLMSQFALIGQGINNGSFFDRVLYPAFLTYLHTFFGQEYTLLMAVQAAIFAVLPAMMYMLGEKLYGRIAGLSLGLLSAFRGVNQINIGNIIDTAHQKQMLTEYPTTVLLVIITLLLLMWMQKPKYGWFFAGLSGGILGLSTLLRPHTLVIIPVFILLALWVYGRRKKAWFGLITLFMMSAYLSLLPWIQFGGQGITVVSLYKDRIITIVNQRYQQFGTPVRPAEHNNQSGNVDDSAVVTENVDLPKDKSVVEFTFDHFINNLVTAVQILPNTPYFLRPWDVVKKTDLFWKPYWDGSMSFWAKILLPLNLIILAFGLGMAWNKQKLAGFLPLLVMIAYFLVNSLGRTSGGRYLVPADWAVIVYYVLGFFTVIEILFGLFFTINTSREVEESELMPGISWVRKGVIVLTVSFMLGTLLPLSQRINGKRFAAQSETEKINELFSVAGESIGLDKLEVTRFLAGDDAVLVSGRSLYPRQFVKDEGLDASVYDFYHVMPYPRTFFTLIGIEGEKEVILPRSSPAMIPNSTDVMVIGCKEKSYIRAWAVIRMDDGSISKQTPESAVLGCPLIEPVCDNNNYCR